jgi:hypothetical protein
MSSRTAPFVQQARPFMLWVSSGRDSAHFPTGIPTLLTICRHWMLLKKKRIETGESGRLKRSNNAHYWAIFWSTASYLKCLGSPHLSVTQPTNLASPAVKQHLRREVLILGSLICGPKKQPNIPSARLSVHSFHHKNKSSACQQTSQHFRSV